MTVLGPATTAAADARIPADHLFAAHLRRVAAAEPHRVWTPADGALPSLYLSHGGGPMPFWRPEWLDPLYGWARSHPYRKTCIGKQVGAECQLLRQPTGSPP